MSGIADNNTKLALVGGIYFSVAMIVGIGFTLRGAELQAQHEAATFPATQLVKPVSAAQGDERSDLRKERDAQIGDDIGGNFDSGSLMEPALELVAKRVAKSAVRRIVF